jgi:hypothetical protein
VVCWCHNPFGFEKWIVKRIVHSNNKVTRGVPKEKSSSSNVIGQSKKSNL